MTGKRIVKIGAALVGLGIFSTGAFAQATPAGAAAEAVRSIQGKTIMPAPGQQVVPEYRADERPAMDLQPGLKIHVGGFKVTGNSAIETSELNEVLAEYVDKDLDGAELVQAAKKVRRLYTNRGYFLSIVYLPIQVIHNHIVEIAVLEGRLGKVTLNVDPSSPVRESLIQGILEAHLKAGGLITEASVERPLLLIRDLPGIEVKSSIDPGETTGTADLNVSVTRSSESKFAGSIDADNNGSKYSGEYRGGISAGLQNLFGIGDRLTVRGQTDLEGIGTGSTTLSYISPVSYYGTKASVSVSRVAYKLNQQFSGSEGTADLFSVNYVHPVIRQRNQNVLLRAGIDYTKTHDVSTLQIEPGEREIRGANIEISADLTDSYYGYTFGAITFRGGKSDAQNFKTLLADQQGLADGDFSRVKWSLTRSQQLPAGFYLELALSGQSTGRNLPQVEKFALTGPDSVRAYPVGSVVGDEGQLYTFELRHAVSGLDILGAPLSLSVFGDWGWVNQNHNNGGLNRPEETNYLERGGVGFGLSAGVRDNWLFKLSVAVPLTDGYNRKQTDDPQHDTRVYFFATKSF